MAAELKILSAAYRSGKTQEVIARAARSMYETARAFDSHLAVKAFGFDGLSNELVRQFQLARIARWHRKAARARQRYDMRPRLDWWGRVKTGS